MSRRLSAAVVLALTCLVAPSLIQLMVVEDPLVSPWWIEGRARESYGAWAFARLPRNSGEVIRGSDGRLFHTESFRYLRGLARRDTTLDGDNTSQRAIVTTQQQLADHDVDLLIVLVPPKAAVVSQDPPKTPRQWDGLDSWKEALSAKGVELLDLTELVRGAAAPSYLLHDTHWSPATASLAARYVADVLEERGLRPIGERSEFDHRRVVVRARGDLAELLPGGRALEGEELTLHQVALTYDGRAPIGATDSPVVLLGDSFTLAFSDPRLGLGRQAGFAEHLADALGMPLDVVAIPGGAATQARRAFARRGSGLSGKRLVIWQIAQRDILRARDGWHTVDLSAPSITTTSADGEIETRIRLLDHLVPETIDYADCLVLLPFERVGANPELPERFTVGAWGWRDFEALAPLALRPGDELEVTLKALDQAVSLENTCWMGDLGAANYFAVDGL